MELDFKIEVMTKDGVVIALINGRRYRYEIDHAIAKQVYWRHFDSPGKALALLKKKARSYERL